MAGDDYKLEPRLARQERHPTKKNHLGQIGTTYHLIEIKRQDIVQKIWRERKLSYGGGMQVCGALSLADICQNRQSSKAPQHKAFIAKGTHQRAFLSKPNWEVASKQKSPQEEDREK